MTVNVLNESDVELAALGWLQDLGYHLLYGPELAPGQPGADAQHPHPLKASAEGLATSGSAHRAPPPA